MTFDPEIKELIAYYIAASIPFAAYKLPDEKVMLTNDFEHEFIISKFINEGKNGIPESTDYGNYITNVSKLIDILKKRSGKTVISRTITGKIYRTAWADIAEQIFNKYPSAFCFIYYTPSTGAWLGASPEVLIKADKENNFYTMSLAGTHAIGEQWDEKNIREQQIVTEFISDTLHPLCSKIIIGDTKNLQYGKIEHLCTCIKGKLLDNIDVMTVIKQLSPTPAVAGYPRDVALKEIEQFENHSRECYSGYIAIQNEYGISAFVNLRCLQFTPQGDYCIYVGGGITAASTPECEWEETNAKASVLLSILNDYTNV